MAESAMPGEKSYRVDNPNTESKQPIKSRDHLLVPTSLRPLLLGPHLDNLRTSHNTKLKMLICEAELKIFDD